FAPCFECQEKIYEKIYKIENNYRFINEYENGESKEAIFVKDLDRFEMILQAFEYEKCVDNSLVYSAPFADIEYPLTI
ncbi:hypothetical protein BC937DRAFT_86746, partial [Endogone sp. FLAS-F59071]